MGTSVPVALGFGVGTQEGASVDPWIRETAGTAVTLVCFLISSHRWVVVDESSNSLFCISASVVDISLPRCNLSSCQCLRLVRLKQVVWQERYA